MDLQATDHLLCTTRSVRKRLDLAKPVEPDVIEKCIEISMQAPTGSNNQGWRVLVVTDADKRKAIADLYKSGIEMYVTSGFMPEFEPDTLQGRQQPRVLDSAMYLAEHLHEVPVHVLYCIEGRVEELPPVAQASVYGSVLPAAWSFMLAAKARGLGSAWTTIHLFYEKEVSEILGIPDDFTQAVLLPTAYFTGNDFKPAKRVSPRELTYWNGWGETK